MTETIQYLPIEETQTPADQPELIAAVQALVQARSPIYPIGGGTSLDYGRPARKTGVGLSLTGLNRIVDYPARDMTITVEAGVTIQTLAETLAGEKQRLPIDVPLAQQATIGGVVATNFNGPRRYGLGLMRDYVIGVSAIDGRGTPFKGGGRVVKNVAGYDFCKLLTGSLGTLGVITQLTLRLRPTPEVSMLLVCNVADLGMADTLLDDLASSQTTPVAIELLAGPAWSDDIQDSPDGYALAVGLEGTAAEVDWMKDHLSNQWRRLGVADHRTLEGSAADDFWKRLTEFPAGQAPLVIKAVVRPSQTTTFVQEAQRLDAQCSVQAHAGSGVVMVRFDQFPEMGLAQSLIGTLQASAASSGGSVVILSNPAGNEMTHQAAWGTIDAPLSVMNEVKRQFDPHHLLNPGRFVFS